MQQLVINKVETNDVFRMNLEENGTPRDMDPRDVGSTAITRVVAQVATFSESKAIVAFSTSGGTAVGVSQLRPTVPIVAACDNVRVARQLSLVWGVFPLVVDKADLPFSVTHEIDRVAHKLSSMGFTDRDNDLLTFVVGLPWGTPGSTNMIRVVSAAGTDFWFDKKNPGMMKNYALETKAL